MPKNSTSSQTFAPPPPPPPVRKQLSETDKWQPFIGWLVSIHVLQESLSVSADVLWWLAYLVHDMNAWRKHWGGELTVTSSLNEIFTYKEVTMFIVHGSAGEKGDGEEVDQRHIIRDRRSSSAACLACWAVWGQRNGNSSREGKNILY